MARPQAVIVAGAGFRLGATAEEIEALVRQALALHGAERIDLLATEAGKASEPGFQEAARRLSVALVACAAADLQGVTDRLLTHSARVQEATGLPAIAEAAALVAAGRNSRLLGPRLASARVTCAIAVGDGR
ncbi:cobalamin biosynthesis protein [Reyranella sp.]|uniref:cobalamin biosynthesis protein n=1 Tax=Reyranella sp. TaxID=1929291 RepID=UPI0037850421